VHGGWPGNIRHRETESRTPVKCTGEEQAMPTSAWRFSGTEGADDAAVKLKALADQDLIEVQDLTVIRWPRWSDQPFMHEHVTDEARGVSAMVSRRKHPVIDSSITEAAKSDMKPGTSVVVMLSDNAYIDAIAGTFQGLGRDIELTRTDLSVPEQDQLRAAISHAVGGSEGPL
jgi:uncharacterized membrane protein